MTGGALGRRATILLIGFSLAAVLLAEWWHHAFLLGDLFEQREIVLAQRQQVLALERELLLARSDESEIVSAGRASLVEPLRQRLDRVESAAAELATEVVTLRQPLEPLRLALGKYRQSVESELRLLTRIGVLGRSGSFSELRSLERDLLSSVPEGQREDLLRLQVKERQFASTLQPSSALSLLESADQLVDQGDLSPESRQLLGRYRTLVESAMSDVLALELVRSESSLRFARLPPMFQSLEQGLNERLDTHLRTITRQRRNAGRVTAALLLLGLCGLALRVRGQRRENLRLQARIASLADGLEAFAAGRRERDLDLPKTGRLGAVTEAFHSMAQRIRHQMETTRRERNRAEEALRVKSDFLARVSHELRTPLHGILGMAELLLQSSRDERQQHLVTSIRRSGSTLLSVVNDLLDYSKLEAGKLVLAQQDFDLVELCETQLAVHATAAHAKGLEIFLTTSDRAAPVQGDPLRLGQVLTNLLGNAIKFTDSGFVHLALYRTAADSGGPTPESRGFEIRVRDTGPGIPPALRQKIFESFAQAAPVSRRSEGGSGLGLSIVQELLALMRGAIRIEEPQTGDESGIVFVVELNFPTDRTKPESSQSGASQAELAGRRALLVESSVDFARSLVERLQQIGMSLEWRPRVEDVDSQTLEPMDIVLVGLSADLGRSEWPAVRPWLERLEKPAVLLVPAGWNESAVASVQEVPRVGRLVDIEDAVASSLGMAPPARAASPWLAAQSFEISGRILLVEDNPVNCEVVQLMLEDCGCEVVTVGNGREAVETLRSERFDVVLMDCHMPKMDGYEATRRVRAHASGPNSHTPILALTASVLDEDRERCQEAGMDAVLSKPISQLELKLALHQWVGDSLSRPPQRIRRLPN
ncbi:MAG: response regulator [Acidobacteriota bacterium]